MRIVINGFGRIGRTILRQLVTRPGFDDIDVVLVNDIASLEMCAYLFKYDSTFGPLRQRVEIERDGLRIDDRHIPFTSNADIATLDLSGADVVLECSGQVNSRKIAERGLAAGAKAVLISGPSDHADITAVVGVNEGTMSDARIVSNSSCTTNALAPLLRLIDATLGIDRAHVTTIHCFTGSQPMVDAPRGNLARSRAGAESMVPTSTSAADELQKVLPGLGSRISIAAVLVPSLSVSAIDATLQLASSIGTSGNDFLRALADGSAVVSAIDDPCVSRDLRARPESLILALPETQTVGDRQLRLFGWYDNEWGFSARMIDMARRLAA